MKINTFASSSIIYILTAFSNAAIPLALIPILTAYLDPNEYGQISLFSLLITALIPIVGLSVEGVAMRKYYDDNDKEIELKKFIGSCINIMTLNSIFILILFIFSYNFLEKILNLPFIWIAISLFSSSFAFITNILLGQMQVRGKAIFYGTIQIMMSILNFSLSILFVVILEMDAEGRMIAISLSMILFGFISLIFMILFNFVEFNSKKEHYSEALNFGLPLIIHSIGTLLVTMSDRYIVGEILGLSQLGIYMIAIQIASILGILFSAINNAFVPWLFDILKNNKYEDKLLVVKKTYIYFLSCILLGIFTYFLSPYAIFMFADNKYYEAADFVGLIVLSQIFVGMYYMVVNYIIFVKKTFILGAITTISGIINIILLIYMVNLYSINGAAWAMLLTMAFRFFVTWIVAARSHPMPWLFWNKKMLLYRPRD